MGTATAFTSGREQLRPCCASRSAARARKHFLSHSCCTFSFQPRSASSGREMLRILQSPSCSRVSPRKTWMWGRESKSFRKHNYWKKQTREEKKGIWWVFFSSRCDFLFFHALSESRLRVMHARCYWGMCFLFVACRRGLFYLSRGWRRIPSQSTTRGSGQKAKPRGGKEEERGGNRKERVGWAYGSLLS